MVLLVEKLFISSGYMHFWAWSQTVSKRLLAHVRYSLELATSFQLDVPFGDSGQHKLKSLYTWKCLAWIEHFLPRKCWRRICYPICLEFKCSKRILKTGDDLGNRFFPFSIFLAEVKDISCLSPLTASRRCATIRPMAV